MSSIQTRAVWTAATIASLAEETGLTQRECRESFNWPERWLREHVEPSLASGHPLTRHSHRALVAYLGSESEVIRMLRNLRPSGADWTDLLPAQK